VNESLRPAPPASAVPDVETTRAVTRARRALQLPPAGVVSQVAAYLEIVLALGLLCTLVDNEAAFATIAIALGAGALVSITTRVGRFFANLSGVVVALSAMAAALVLAALSDRFLGNAPWLPVLAVGAVVVGLDWCYVPRLRARVVCSGLLVVPLIGADADWAYPGAIGWFVGALVTLWLLERDARHAATRPVPLVTEAPPSPTRPFDVVRTVAIGLLVGGACALLLGDMRCSFG
jgi:hypothetical protein